MKKKILLVIIILLIIIGILLLGIMMYNRKKNADEIASAIDGVVIAEYAPFYTKPETKNVKQIRTLNKCENVYILEEFQKDGIDWYKVKVDGKKNGYVRAETVDYYKEVNSEKVLVSDVSQFNKNEDFSSQGEYEVFLLENHINYVYIRAGGRGYGDKGIFYEDKEYQMYVDACEYLKIPYGFYFLDESLNSKEIDEQVNFIKDFLKNHSGNYCKLPVALDIERHPGGGRADDIWDKRAQLVQELTNDLKKENINSIIYTNAQTANLYLSSVDTKFWIAYYPEIDTVPDYWYFDTEQEGAGNTELQKKTVGWQFTEKGVADEITSKVDISLFKKNFAN